MIQQPKILFLYTELAGYMLKCFHALAASGVEVHVVIFPINPEAPFQFKLDHPHCYFYDRSNFSRLQLEQLILEIKPQAMVTSGWVDADYVALARKFRSKIQQVVAFDTLFDGELKSLLSAVRARFVFKNAFNKAWVPGLPQREFARAMGFANSQIKTGLYTADVAHLSSLEWNDRGIAFPKRFVFAGRYVDFKGITFLWKAFSEIKTNDWQLYCAGTGPLFEQRSKADGIHHLGFVQPIDFDTFASQGGVFVLPSLREPWGVVVHEFAAAGYPLLCSDKVGSNASLLSEGENGFVFKSGSTNPIADALEQVIGLSSAELWKMGAKSKELAAKLTIENWVKTAREFLKPKNE